MILDTYMNNIDIHPDIKRISESVDSLDYINDPYEYLVSAVYENQLISMQLDTAIMCKEYTYLKENGEELLYEANIFVAIIDAMKKIITSVWNAITSFFKTIFGKSKSEGTERNKQRVENVEKRVDTMIKENEKRVNKRTGDEKKAVDGDSVKHSPHDKLKYREKSSSITKTNYKAKGNFDIPVYDMTLPKRMMNSVKDLWDNCTFSFNLSGIDLKDLAGSKDKNASYARSEEAYQRQEKFLNDKMEIVLKNILKHSGHDISDKFTSGDNFIALLGSHFLPVTVSLNTVDFDEQVDKFIKMTRDDSFLSLYKSLYQSAQKTVSEWMKLIDQYEKQYKSATKDADKVALSLYSKMMQWDRSIVNKATSIIAEIYRLGNRMVEKRIQDQDKLLLELFSAFMDDDNVILVI